MPRPGSPPPRRPWRACWTTWRRRDRSGGRFPHVAARGRLQHTVLGVAQLLARGTPRPGAGGEPVGPGGPPTAGHLLGLVEPACGVGVVPGGRVRRGRRRPVVALLRRRR